MNSLINMNRSIQEVLITILLFILIYLFVNIGNKYLDSNKKLHIKKRYIFYFIIIIMIIYIIYQLFIKTEGMGQLIYAILISIIITYLLNPIVNFMEKKKIERIWGVIIIYFTIVALIVLLSMSIIPRLIEEFRRLINILPNYFNQINNISNQIYDIYSNNLNNLPEEFHNIKESFDQNLYKIQSAVITSAENFVNSIMSFFSKLLTILIVPILTFYFLKDKDHFKKKIYKSIPKQYRADVVSVSRDIDLALGKFIRGQLIVAAFVGIGTTLGLLLLRVDFALIIGLIAGIFNIIPYFGPIIGIIPAIVFAALENPSKVLWVIILFISIQQIEGNFLSPKIVGESVGLHPVIVIIALLIGGGFMGILGMLLAIPVIVIMRVIVNFGVDKLVQ